MVLNGRSKRKFNQAPVLMAGCAARRPSSYEYMMDPPSGTDYFEGQPPTLPRMLQPGSESDDDITSARSSDALSDSGSASESDAGSEDEEQDLIEKLVESAGSEIFELVNEIDSAICPPCINIISAFSNGSVPIMTREKRSESSLLHHKTVKGLVECSTTCGICALILHVLDLSGAQFDTLRKPLTAAERELSRLRWRDRDIVTESLAKSEKFYWKRELWRVLTNSIKPCLRKHEGELVSSTTMASGKML
ncbi:uncharacterized protein L3040_003593 [Drepanopeziza brunnea f. sp. 'multigermtubi']|uniref:uncharacterized protein n=1 Tax=Drepanopeziza brunnea f. sp. 'multigermtubi' TaxID=698441 RepID=UPI002397B09F|nr:hypothetical protein L3040_003593 [Drepanopeziza brunnea f. sp. 'multigermtubi']